MQKVLDYLFKELTEEGLRELYCAWDSPSEIQFRLGLSGQHRILFGSRYQDDYCLELERPNEKTCYIPIDKDSDNFRNLQKIYQSVREITREDNYKKSVENATFRNAMTQKLNSIVNQSIRLLI